VTAFIIACAAMIAAALLWILIPLWRNRTAEVEARERRVAALVTIVAVPAIAIGLYTTLSNWQWDPERRANAEAAALHEALAHLKGRVERDPNDLEAWLLLGRSYASVGQFGQAAEAFERAHELSQGTNLEALVGLGEALFFTDQTSLSGRAGQLFEAALTRAPNHPKALWYGSVAALERGDLRTGRDRLQRLLDQNPPPELQAILQKQIDALTAQLGDADSAQAKTQDGNDPRTIEVSVAIAPEIEQQLTQELTLFVLARDPAGGPPLAVQRHSSTSIPLTVRLTEYDAMVPARTIATVPRVEVVARLSRSGSPQAQSGDYFGSASFEFGKTNGTLNIIIDQVVP